MTLRLVRSFQDWSVTLGIVQILGERHLPIYSLENPLRATHQDSLIKAGLYTLRPYTSQRWPDVYELVSVPGRTSILIHHGNFESDTAGCILVGLGAGVLREQAAVLQSKQAMEYLRKILGRETHLIEVLDGPWIRS